MKSIDEKHVVRDLEVLARIRLVPSRWKFWRRRHRRALLERIGRSSIHKATSVSLVKLWLQELSKESADGK